MQTKFGANAQMVTHPDYKETLEQYLVKMQADSSNKSDTPDDIAGVVYKAVIDNKKQLHYTAGELSTKEYEWLNREGIDQVIGSMNSHFFND